MARELPISIVTTGYGYQARLHPALQVGALAGYLSQIERAVETSTLELARPLAPDTRIQSLDLQAGDRLLVASPPVKTSALPAAAAEEDLHVRLSMGSTSVSSAGKTQLVMGKPDPFRQFTPDVDLRAFVPAQQHEYLSRDCLRLEVQDGSWYAQRSGQTRVMIDELEVLQTPVRLNEQQRLRLYRSSDKRLARPLAEIDLLLEVREGSAAALALPQGTLPVSVHVGAERATEFVNASEHLTLRQIIAALAQHHQLSLGGADVYLLRLLAPGLPVENLVGEALFFHAPLELRHARRLLRLSDAYHPGQSYSVPATRTASRRRLGWQPAQSRAQAALDVDLTPSLTMQPPTLPDASAVKALLHYDAFAEQWSLQAEDAGQVGVFVNNRQVSAAPVALAAGDTISFGLSVSHHFVRLTADIFVQ